jgi:quercetin dioxygenase-like cupin family protein
MPKRLPWLALVVTAITLTALYRPRTARATKVAGYKTTILALGRFSSTELLHALSHGDPHLSTSQPASQASSDVYVQSNTWAPGGSTGWHSHPGDSLIIVTAGTITDYEGHDPACTPHVYKTGMSFVDPGGHHVHILRNQGTVEAKTIAVQFIPADAARRIEVADPGNCHF